MQLEDVLLISGRQFFLYGDRGYNQRLYLELPFQGSVVRADHAEFIQGMSGTRITVEWMFKEIKTY